MRKKLVVIIPLLLVLGYTFFLYSYQPKIENSLCQGIYKW